MGGVGTDRPPLPKVHSSKKSSNTATSSTNATAAKTEHPKKQSADKAKPTKVIMNLYFYCLLRNIVYSK